MAVVQHDAPVPALKAADFGGKRFMVGGVIGTPVLVDLLGRGGGTIPVQRQAVEIGGRAEFGGGLTGIERYAARVPVDIDDIAGRRGTDDRSTQFLPEIVKLVDPPVGVFQFQRPVGQLAPDAIGNLASDM